MKTVPLKLVTIVAEAVLEDRLVRDLSAVGARGYTVTTVRGRGSRGVRASDWEGGNVRVEVLVTDAVSDRVLDLLAERYFPSYAVVAWVERVEVVRGDKYV
jgi:nitrogen regulatory protein P-II 2